jgi:sugar phosphate isomerase/epimerase
VHPLSLDHVTIDVTPPELLRIAGACGCPMVNLRIHTGRLPLSYDFVGNPAMQRETRQRARDLGIAVGVAESFNIGPETRVADFDPGFEAAAAIGAQYVNTHGMDPDHNRQVENFQAFCERASKFGLEVSLEWFRRSVVNSLELALELVRATPRMVLMVDALHVVRTGAALEQLSAIEHGRIGWMQICDGPAQVTPEYAEAEGRFNRMIPGEGEFPLRAIVAALPPDVPIGVEVPSKAALEAGTTPEQWARKAVGSTRRLLESFGVELLTLD